MLNDIITTGISEVKVARFSEKQINLFWSKVDIRGEDDCWEWQGGKDKDGYGTVKRDGKSLRSNRVAYELVFGEPQHNVLHSCDNPACCNPNHLWDGTHKENMEDMVSKNRKPKTIKKMTMKRAMQLRGWAAKGKTKKFLKDKYGLSVNHIQAIINNHAWVQ
jgi:hypothetical protein